MQKRSPWKTLATLTVYLWPSGRLDLKVRVILAMAFLVAAKAVNVYVPFLYKQAIDALTPGTAMLAVPVFLILAYGVGRVAAQAFGELRDFVFAKVAQHAQRVIGLQTFQHLHHLSLRFHLERQTGGLSRVIERGMRGISFVLSFMLFNILPTLIEIGLVTGILLSKFDWRFAAITFASIALYIFFTLAITEWRTKYRRDMNDRDTEANTKAIDSLLNYETVKYFGNEEHEYARFDKALEGYEKAAVQSQSSLSFLNVGQGFIIGVGLVAVMWLAANGVKAGTLTVGDFVLVNTFLIQLYLPLNFLGFVYREVKNSLVDMEKMFELIEVNAEIKDTANAKQLDCQDYAVSFEDVTFGYQPERTILKGVSFTIKPGGTLAVVGPSGSGKSTLARLLFRFYDVTGGRITLDGQDIRQVSQKSLRAAIGVVPQDTVLFNDTIEYNIRYGKPSATKEEIEQAARMAKIHDFVLSLPDGYRTMVGERGLKLSGGEKQRVAIARTILKNPAILIFDEATSALDSHTEKEIQASLDEVSRTRTTLMIAHRLSTVVHADEIVVLREGRVVERGTHPHLLALGGEYAAMWKKQLEERAAKTDKPL